MEKYFIDTKLPDDMTFYSVPKLYYVSTVEEKDNIYPRIMHRHDDLLEILLIVSGEGHYFIGGTSYHVKKGDVLIINSGVIHDEQINTDEGLSIYCCAFKMLHLLPLRKNALIEDDQNPVFQSSDHFYEIKEIFEILFSMVQKQSNFYEQISQYLGKTLLSLVYYGVLKSSKNDVKAEIAVDPLALRVKRYIDENFSKQLNLQKIATDNHASQYYISHLFSETYGYSPMQYLLRRRIGEAQTLLLITDKSISYIASSVGYDNVSNFNLVFRNKVGMSPGKYRKKYLEIAKEPIET
ncbi:AraC family transcriptional regulator [Enterococcus sp. AZ109]|uniref:AraC family transcriptional regulator n=1 Tax=Enterococcus sp. AZ109 TaxID=2774634 RepID=UPI003F1EC1B2